MKNKGLNKLSSMLVKRVFTKMGDFHHRALEKTQWMNKTSTGSMLKQDRKQKEKGD